MGVEIVVVEIENVKMNNRDVEVIVDGKTIEIRQVAAM